MTTEKNTALHIAAHKGHLQVVRFLIEAHADVDADDENGCTPLHLAAIEGHTSTVEHLLNRGAAIDAKDELGSTPLHLAVREGYTLSNTGSQSNTS